MATQAIGGGSTASLLDQIRAGKSLKQIDLQKLKEVFYEKTDRGVEREKDREREKEEGRGEE